MDAYNKDPEAELKRIGGRIVGNVQDPSLDMHGHARLVGICDISDKEVETLNTEGKISLSTGFYAMMGTDKDGVKTTAGPVKPHHVLLFEETRTDQPRDLGTGLLNQSKGKDGNMPEKEKDEQNVNMAPLLQELNASKVELKAKGEELEKSKAEVTKKDAEIEAMRNKLAAIEKADKDAKWEGLKNSYIPPDSSPRRAMRRRSASSWRRTRSRSSTRSRRPRSTCPTRARMA